MSVSLFDLSYQSIDQSLKKVNMKMCLLEWVFIQTRDNSQFYYWIILNLHINLGSLLVQ